MQLLRDNLVSSQTRTTTHISKTPDWHSYFQTLWTSSEAEPAATETSAAPATETKETEAAPTEAKADAE